MVTSRHIFGLVICLILNFYIVVFSSFSTFLYFSFHIFITTLICFVIAGHVLTHFWSQDLSEGELVNETIWPIALSDVRDTALYIVLLISFSSLLLFPLYFFFLFISFSSLFLFPLYFFFLFISGASFFLFSMAFMVPSSCLIF